MADYSKMTTEEFDELLQATLSEMKASQILAIPGVYEAVSEELNNDILEAWAERNPEKAYPEEVMS